MEKICIICHGNICRSPIGEILLNKKLKENGLDSKYEVFSRATSREEIGNDIYPPMKRVLDSYGLKYDRHEARQLAKFEFDSAKYIIYMDAYNLYNLEKLYGLSDKYILISKYDNKENIEDPWYTGRYDYVYKRIDTCLDSIMEILKQNKSL